MIRRLTAFLLAVLLCCATCATASAAEIYTGNLNSTITQYMKDILSGMPINDHYIYYRSGQYQYTMVTGDLKYDSGLFSLADVGTVYTIATDNSYNGSYSYSVSSLDSFTLSVGDQIIYSDLGAFPQLIERSDKYEIYTAILITISMLSIVISRILSPRYRRGG